MCYAKVNIQGDKSIAIRLIKITIYRVSSITIYTAVAAIYFNEIYSIFYPSLLHGLNWFQWPDKSGKC